LLIRSACIAIDTIVDKKSALPLFIFTEPSAEFTNSQKMRKVYASMCLADPSLVPEYQCRVPEGAELSDFGKKMRAKLQWFAEGRAGDWEEPTRITQYLMMPASLFKKNAHYAPAPGDLVVVGGNPRNTITSAIVMRVGSFVMTNSRSVYELRDECEHIAELVKVYPMLPFDMVDDAPERVAATIIAQKLFPNFCYQ
jgi:hypothetical protein